MRPPDRPLRAAMAAVPPALEMKSPSPDALVGLAGFDGDLCLGGRHGTLFLTEQVAQAAES